MKQKIKLAIVDDHYLFREGLISLINEFDNIEIILEASNGTDLTEQLKTKKPDVILLDIRMPKMDGFQVMEFLQLNHPQILVLILSMSNDDAGILKLLKSGARGFLLKDNDINTVVNAISAVIETGYYFNERVSKTMVRELIDNNLISPQFKPVALSLREMEIIKLICREFTNKEIATHLCISIRTVDGHKEKILRKTNAKNAIGIVMFAVRNNLLD